MKTNKLLLIFVSTFLTLISSVYSQDPNKKDVFVEIPLIDTLNYTKIYYDIHPINSSLENNYAITFNNIRDNNKKENSFLFITKKEFVKIDFVSFKYKHADECLSLKSISDSLSHQGRNFFKKYNFYLAFIRGSTVFYHTAFGEYLYKKLTGDYSEN